MSKRRSIKPDREFFDGKVVLYGGDCMGILAKLLDNSVDAVVTDPPYHLTSIVKRFGAKNAAPAKVGKTGAYARASRGFMGKQWDGGDIAFRPEVWTEVLRTLKPGGHIVAFGGTRTYHRLATAIETAGFDIRDVLLWHYGSGFPKSINIAYEAENRLCTYDSAKKKWFYKSDGEPRCDAPPFRDDDANEWAGYGSALKPATEIICLARKPLSEPTVLANVLRWGTGALNIDACRIPHMTVGSGNLALNPHLRKTIKNGATINPSNIDTKSGDLAPSPLGRFPANLCHDGSPEVLAGFPASGSGSGKVNKAKPGAQPFNTARGWNSHSMTRDGATAPDDYGDQGSAARFFYTAKADSDDRLASKHATVKPVDLMKWLVRLVCPKGGLCLDPFAGTGTTGSAAFIEGCRSILIEREDEYQSDIVRRMELLFAGPDEKKQKMITQQTSDALPLFRVLSE